MAAMRHGDLATAWAISDAVLRHLVVKMDSAVTEPSPMARAEEDEGGGGGGRRERIRDEGPSADEDESTASEGAS